MSITFYAGAPVGPAFIANAFVVSETDTETGIEYHLQLFPDMFNDKLRADKKPMWFYYIPDAPRLAKNDQGNWMFHFTRYAGVVDSTSHVGVGGAVEAAGGVVAFSTTMRVPDGVIEKAILRLMGKGKEAGADKLFAWAEGQPPPRIGVVPIVNAETYVASLSPQELANPEAAAALKDAWAWKLEGAGQSARSPTAVNAFTAVVGPFPAAIIEQAIRGQSSPIFVHTKLQHKFWTTPIRIVINANWERVFTHLSAAFEGRVWFLKTDLQGEYNKLLSKGVIERKLFIDGEQIGADRQKEIETRAQLLFDKFVDQAEKVIFLPAPEVKPAEAKAAEGIFGFLGAKKAFSLKARRDVTQVSLSYDEEINQTFVWDNTISAHIKGFFDEISKDAANVAKYMSVVDLGQSFQKVHILAKSNAFWGDEREAGDPIQSISVEVAYPTRDGTLQNKNSARFTTPGTTTLSATPEPAVWTAATRDRIYVFDFVKNDTLGERANEIHVKEHIVFKESPRVEVDAFENERVTSESVVEVRAESLGGLVVGPIRFDRTIDSPQIEVAVTFQSGSRPEETLRFDSKNMAEDRYFKIWAKPVAGGTPWKYKVGVSVKGKKFTQKTLRWEGPFIDMVGSTELTAAIPDPPADIDAKLGEYLGE